MNGKSIYLIVGTYLRLEINDKYGTDNVLRICGTYLCSHDSQQ